MKRYSIHIQATDYSERVCELWVKSPSGRVTRKVLRRTLSPAMEGSRVKGGKVYYWIDSTNTGTKLVTGTKIGNSEISYILRSDDKQMIFWTYFRHCNGDYHSQIDRTTCN